MLTAMGHLSVNPPPGRGGGWSWHPTVPRAVPGPQEGPVSAPRPSSSGPRKRHLSAVLPPWSEGHGGQRPERPSSLQDWSPSRQAQVAKPCAAASSCGEVGRSGRVWIPVRGLRQVGSPPYLRFQRECRDQEAAGGPEGRLALDT